MDSKKRGMRGDVAQTPLLSAEELLCLQLAGYSPRQLHGDTECHIHLKEEAQKHVRELDRARRILEAQALSGVETIPYYADDYPFGFRNLADDAPPLIHLLGNRDLLNRKDSVTIIGARAADREGLDIAYRLGGQMARQGHAVVSGLALGCDTAAHRGCLDAGGKTIAIVASGLDITHPKQNRDLQNEIADNGGAVLSEHPFGVKANPTRLVARCRMQVVMSPAVIVVQCKTTGGTMHAARFALKYGNGSTTWQNRLYAVEYKDYDERNAGNRLLLDSGIAAPVLETDKERTYNVTPTDILVADATVLSVQR